MVLLGKNKTPVSGQTCAPKSSSGWSARGLTRNPVLLTHSASGSSSGSAAAVAVGWARRGNRDGDQWLHHQSCQRLRHCRIEADGGFGEPKGIIPITHWRDTGADDSRRRDAGTASMSSQELIRQMEQNQRGGPATSGRHNENALRPDALKGAPGVVRKWRAVMQALSVCLKNTLGVCTALDP